MVSPGAPGGRLENHLAVRVKDGKGSGISKLRVSFATTQASGSFIPFPGETVYVQTDERALATTIANSAKTIPATSTTPEPTATDSNVPIYVQTDSSGGAKTYYQLGETGGTHDVTVSAAGGTATIFAYEGTTGGVRQANLEIVSGNPQSGAKGKNLDSPLVVIARSTAGYRIPNVVIQFRTVTGILSPVRGTEQPNDATVGGSPRNPPSGQQIYVVTGANGEAGVTYNVGQTVVARDVIAEVRLEVTDESQYDFAIDRVVFNVNGRAGTGGGGGGGGGGSGGGGSDPTNTITIVPSSIDGEPGEEIDISISSSPSTVVILESGELDNADFSRLFGTTPFDVTIELPDEEDDYTFSATAPGFTTATATVTVEEEEVALGRLSIVAVGAPSNGQQTVRITVRDSDGVLAVGAVSVTLTGTGVNRTVPTANGSGAAVIPVPNTVSVQAEGYRVGYAYTHGDRTAGSRR